MIFFIALTIVQYFKKGKQIDSTGECNFVCYFLFEYSKVSYQIHATDFFPSRSHK